MTQFVALNETEVNLEINSMNFEPPKDRSLSGVQAGQDVIVVFGIDYSERWQGQTDSTHIQGAQTFLCFSPNVFWELNIFEKFWYQGLEINGNKESPEF